MNEIKKIILEMDDGTVQKISKGFIADFNQEEKTITFNMVNVSPKDIDLIISAFATFSEKLISEK